jgi:hypothetical protein
MKVFLSCLVITIISLTVLPGFAAAQDAIGPRIVVNEMRFDAGKVVQGSKVSHVFGIKSAGTATLVIERVQSG